MNALESREGFHKIQTVERAPEVHSRNSGHKHQQRREEHRCKEGQTNLPSHVTHSHATQFVLAFLLQRRLIVESLIVRRPDPDRMHRPTPSTPENALDSNVTVRAYKS